MNINQQYTNIIQDRMNDIIISQENNIDQVSNLFVKTINNDHKIYFFGTGHSYIVSQEIFARAGGYAGFIPILENELCMNHAFKSTIIERIPEYATVIMELYNFKKNDVIVITSNSGRNGLIVELAIRLKKIGVIIVALTSLTHSKITTSRHQSGKNLYQLADYILDNKTDCGDAAIKHNEDIATGPISTILNCFIIQLVVSNMVQKQIDLNNRVLVFKSSNIDQGDQANAELFDLYK